MTLLERAWKLYIKSADRSGCIPVQPCGISEEEFVRTMAFENGDGVMCRFQLDKAGRLHIVE